MTDQRACTMRIFSLLAVLSLQLLEGRAQNPAVFIAPQQQDPSRVFFEDFKSGDLFRQGLHAEEKGLWAQAIDRYMRVLDLIEGEKRSEVYKIDSNRWVGAGEHVLRRISGFPKQGMDVYRDRFEGEAAHKLKAMRKPPDGAGYEKIIKKYFFTRAAEQAMQELTQRYYDEGRLDEAVYWWNRYLKYYVDPTIPASVVVAKLAHAYALTGNTVGIERVRDQAADRGILNEKVMAGTRAMTLEELLQVSLERVASEPGAPGSSHRFPLIDRTPRRSENIYSNDIRTWSRDLKLPSNDRMTVRDNMWGGIIQIDTSQIVMPAYVRHRGREYLIYQNGSFIAALDPSAPGGREYWTNPEGQSGETGPDTISAGAYATRFGCAAYQDLVVANMVSKKSGRTPTGSPVVKSLRAFRLADGMPAWNTEDKTGADELVYSSIPVVSEDKVYVAAIKEQQPGGFSATLEQEVHLVCFRARTGELLWKSFLCSSNVTNARVSGIMSYNEGPQIFASSGAIYCQTNLGAVVAVDGSSGQIIWATEYESRKDPVANIRSIGSMSSQPPLLHRGVVYALPSDSPAILGLNKDTGDIVETYRIQPGSKDRNAGTSWRRYLLCIRDDLLVAVSSHCIYFIHGPRTSGDELAVQEIRDSVQSGCGLVQDDSLMIPTRTMLLRYSVSEDFALKEETPWDAEGKITGGSIVLGGRYLFCAGNQLTAYIDDRTMLEDYEARLRHDPANPQILLDYGELLYENGYPLERGNSEAREGVLDRAARSLNDYVRMAGDTLTASKLSEIKLKAYNAYLALALFAEKQKEPDWNRVAALSAEAKRFSQTNDQKAMACLRWGGALAKISRVPEAVDQYQEIVTRYRNSLLIQDEVESEKSYYPFVSLAMKAIHGLIQQHGTGIYERHEQEAARMFEKISGNDVHAYFMLTEAYPNSRHAEKALRMAMSSSRDSGRWHHVAATMERMKFLNPSLAQDPAFEFEMADVMERLEDFDRLEAHLKDIKQRLADQDWNGQKCAAIAERRLKEIQAGRKSVPDLKNPLKLLGHLPAGDGASPVLGGRAPLIPLLPYPSTFRRDWELFRNGSAVELWDVRAQKRLWSRAYPGVYLGMRVDLKTRVWIREIRDDSPAIAAGVESGAEIMEIDGQPATPVNFSSLVAGLSPDRPSNWTIRAGETKKTVSIKFSEYPAAARPIVLGVIPTRGYAVAVVWQDAVAALDWWTGQVLWVYRDTSWQGLIQSFEAQRGKILIIESRTSNPHDWFAGAPEGGPATRVVSLDDVSGQVVWMRTLNHADQYNHMFPESRMPRLFGHPASKTVLVGYVTPSMVKIDFRVNELGPIRRSGVAGGQVSQVMHQFVLARLDVNEGVEVGKRKAYSLGSSMSFYLNWDRARGQLFVISTDMQRRRKLECLDAVEPDTDVEWVRFAVTLPPNFSAVTDIPVVAGESYVGVLHPQEGVVLYALSDGASRKVALPAGRKVPQPGGTRSAGLWLDSRTLVVLLNSQASGRLAYLAAFDVSDKETALLWEEPAPFPDVSPLILNGHHKNFLLMYVARGFEPGVQDGESRTFGVVYSMESGENAPSGGYIVRMTSDLAPPPGALTPMERIDPVQAHRDFIYWANGKTVEIYGN